MIPLLYLGENRRESRHNPLFSERRAAPGRIEIRGTPGRLAPVTFLYCSRQCHSGIEKVKLVNLIPASKRMSPVASVSACEKGKGACTLPASNCREYGF